MVDRRVFFGLEFDFLALDDDDYVAVFSSAGYGPLPLAVLGDPDSVREAVEATELLPVVSEVEHARRAGDWSFWLLRAERGLFAYDWDQSYGPYRRVVSPVSPATLASMESLPTRLGALPRLPTRFGDSEVIELAALGVAVSTEPDPRML
jgi:hypothetical protein